MDGGNKRTNKRIFLVNKQKSDRDKNNKKKKKLINESRLSLKINLIYEDMII